MKERITTWIAWHLPRKLVYWCAVRVMTAATVGKYSKQQPSTLLCMEALQRWD